MTKQSLLPSDYQPTAMDVLCGRSHVCYNSEGNRNFRRLVQTNLQRYAEAEKLGKSQIVSEIIEDIHSAGGNFIRQRSSDQWYIVGKSARREKVSSQFRDCLHSKYRSSSKAKNARRAAKRERSASPPAASKAIAQECPHAAPRTRVQEPAPIRSGSLAYTSDFADMISEIAEGLIHDDDNSDYSDNSCVSSASSDSASAETPIAYDGTFDAAAASQPSSAARSSFCLASIFDVHFDEGELAEALGLAAEWYDCGDANEPFALAALPPAVASAPAALQQPQEL